MSIVNVTHPEFKSDSQRNCTPNIGALTLISGAQFHLGHSIAEVIVILQKSSERFSVVALSLDYMQGWRVTLLSDLDTLTDPSDKGNFT
jgi:hypothetical protein